MRRWVLVFLPPLDQFLAYVYWWALSPPSVFFLSKLLLQRFPYPGMERNFDQPYVFVQITEGVSRTSVLLHDQYVVGTPWLLPALLTYRK